MTSSLFTRNLNSKFSRREFFQLLGLGAAGLVFPHHLLSHFYGREEHQLAEELLGRVTRGGHKLYDAPHSESEVLQELPMDSLWQITAATFSEDDTSANRIWYELDDGGFAHSRYIQPVKHLINDVDTSIPEDGCLGEITVPFVDAHTSADHDSRMIYRFYYGATFWVLERLPLDEDKVWYKLLDDRNYAVFYVPAKCVRLVPDSELTPISPRVPWEDKKLVVDLATQSLTAYEGDRVVFMSRISSGVLLREGGFATPRGHYRTTRKRPCRHMANPANDYGSGFDLPGVPWVSYFTSNGVAFHGAYWHNDFGVPHSHGCINMTPQSAKWVYRWTTPTVPPDHYYYSDKNGTRVIVQ